jgi:hypothetical protein
MTSVYELITFNYKGETCPIPRTERFRNNDVIEYMKGLANKTIIENLMEGFSIPTQILILKETLDTLDKSLIETSNGGEINEDTLEIAAQQVEFDIDNKDMFYTLWCISICALLKLKAFKNDENNGILTIRIITEEQCENKEG